MGDTPRILELRRRVQADPASIAFAQLAEECRRLGSNEEAVDICRAGLARNPGYLSARVTLGRALIELGELDAAQAELDTVVAGVPDNLAAIRGLAEILQRRGQMPEALKYYKRALALARHDPDLEDAVERISQAVAPAPAPPTKHVSIEEIFNFDKLIDQLGLSPEEPTPAVALSAAPALAPSLEDLFAEPETIDRPEAGEVDIFGDLPSPPAHEQEPDPPKPTEGLPASEDGLDAIVLTLDDSDALAVMERELRELEQQRAHDEQLARAELEQQRAQAEARLRAELEEQRARDERLRAELEEQRAEEERVRAEQEQHRAQEQERLHAELEEQRAEEERVRAEQEQRREREQERLRAELEHQRALVEERLRAELEHQRAQEEERLRAQLEQQRAQEEERLRAELEHQRAQEEERIRAELEQQHAVEAQRARAQLAQRRQAAAVASLETWLSAIEADREHHNA